MPVRRPSNRGGNTIGWFASFKMQKSVAYESLLECDYLWLLDFAEDVVGFEEQPLTIPYVYAGKSHRYTPDFRVRQANQDVLVECKPQALVETDDNRRKFAAAHAWCAAQGYQFQVLTEREIRAGFRLENVKFLAQFARQAIAPEVRARVVAALAAMPGPTTLTDLAAALTPDNPAALYPAILHLAYHHVLRLPLDAAPVTRETAVWLSGRPGTAS
jgi:hypothetical protein